MTDWEELTCKAEAHHDFMKEEELLMSDVTVTVLHAMEIQDALSDAGTDALKQLEAISLIKGLPPVIYDIAINAYSRIESLEAGAKND